MYRIFIASMLLINACACGAQAQQKTAVASTIVYEQKNNERKRTIHVYSDPTALVKVTYCQHDNTYEYEVFKRGFESYAIASANPEEPSHAKKKYNYYATLYAQQQSSTAHHTAALKK